MLFSQEKWVSIDYMIASPFIFIFQAVSGMYLSLQNSLMYANWSYRPDVLNTFLLVSAGSAPHASSEVKEPPCKAFWVGGCGQLYF